MSTWLLSFSSLYFLQGTFGDCSPMCSMLAIQQLHLPNTTLPHKLLCLRRHPQADHCENMTTVYLKTMVELSWTRVLLKVLINLYLILY